MGLIILKFGKHSFELLILLRAFLNQKLCINGFTIVRSHELENQILNFTRCVSRVYIIVNLFSSYRYILIFARCSCNTRARVDFNEWSKWSVSFCSIAE